jgi:hypothetical protein
MAYYQGYTAVIPTEEAKYIQGTSVICGSHSVDCGDSGLTICDAVKLGNQSPLSLRELPLPSSE